MKKILEELKLSTWLGWRQLTVLVLYTVLTCGIISLLILGIDIFLNKVVQIILKA